MNEISIDEIRDRINELEKREVRNLWVQGFVFLFLVGLIIACALFFIPPDVINKIQAGNPSFTPQTDFLKLAMPVLAVVIGFLISFLGLKRLGQFDAEIENLRKSLELRLSEERLSSENQRVTFRDEISARLKEIKDTVTVVSEKYVAEAIEEKKSEVISGFNEFISKTESVIQEIQEKLEPYSWLSSRSEEVDLLVGINSVGVAHKKVTQLFAEGKADLAIKITEHVIQENITGDANDFHNLAAQLAREDLFLLASKLISCGLKLYPNNVDLLADGIKYFSSNGDIDDAEKVINMLNCIPRKYWNWRAFVFLGDYFELLGQYDSAIALYEDCKKELPYEERAYSQHGGIFKKLGKYDKSIEILEKGLKLIPKAPQTALLLAQSYIEVGNYDKAINAVDRGIQGTADSQPSANISALLWTRAEAKDSLIHSKSVSNKDQLKELIESAILDYRAAMSMPDSISLYRVRGNQRISLLKLFAKERELEIVETEDGSEQVMAAQLLEHIAQLKDDDE